MTFREFEESGGKEIYYPPEVPPKAPENYTFKAVYHMGKLSFYKLEQIIIKNSCGC